MGIRIRDHFNVEDVTFKDLDIFKEVVREIVRSATTTTKTNSSLLFEKSSTKNKFNNFSRKNNIKTSDSEFIMKEKLEIQKNSDYSLAA